MFKRLAESQAQARKAAKMRANAQVGVFNVARADMFQLRHSADWDRHRRFDSDGVVPFGASNVRSAVNLDELCKVNVRTVGFFNRGNVPAQSVRSYLKAANRSFAQVADKIAGTGSSALSDKIGQNHFGFSVNRHPYVAIAPFFRAYVEQVHLHFLV